MELVTDLADRIAAYGPNTFLWTYALSPAHLLMAFLLAALVWHLQGRPDRLLRWMFPRGDWLHPSTLVDLKLFAFNTAFTALGGLAAFWLTPTVAIAVQGALSDATGRAIPATAGPILLLAGGVTIFLLQDLCRWANHAVHHKVAALWPLHAVHHSAEVLTPLTYMRVHPLYRIAQMLLFSTVVASLQGAAVFAVLGPLPGWVHYIGNAAFTVFFFFGGHLQHSHVWLRFGPVLEHVFISPAMHQVHHSSDPKHHDKNFGGMLAIWDWMFGTLYIPERQETLRFGIADAEGTMAPQAHTGLRAALFGPFHEIWEELRKGTSLDPDAAPTATYPAKPHPSGANP